MFVNPSDGILNTAWWSTCYHALLVIIYTEDSPLAGSDTSFSKFQLEFVVDNDFWNTIFEKAHWYVWYLNTKGLLLKQVHLYYSIKSSKFNLINLLQIIYFIFD